METNQLMELLDASPNRFRETALGNEMSVAFHQYLIKLMDERGYDTVRLMKDACVSKTYMYQVINGERTPGRDIILRMALAMKLTIEETQRMLTIAQKGVLYPKVQRDAAILFCIRKKKNLDETNVFLEDMGEELLL